MSKELWFAEYERLLNEAKDRGLSPEAASHWAEKMATYRVQDRVADLIDIERKRRREQ